MVVYVLTYCLRCNNRFVIFLIDLFLLGKSRKRFVFIWKWHNVKTGRAILGKSRLSLKIFIRQHASVIRAIVDNFNAQCLKLGKITV